MRKGIALAGARTGDEERLSLRAGLYFWVVTATAVGVALPLVARLSAGTHDWVTFAVLSAALALAQMFVVVTPANQSYHTTAVFLIPGVLLLPPELVALMPLVQHVPDWLRRRLPFHIQTFNIANYTLAALAAWAAANALTGTAGALGSRGAAAAAAGAAACVVFVAVNHALLAPMLQLARGHSLRETGLFSYASVSADLVVAALGVGLATLWAESPWLAPFALAPLILVHRSLAVPALQAEARIDPKTGLYNARQFGAALDEELERARRFERPVSVLMADLDLLRDINNTYGHLAGDDVLSGIADVFRRELRDFDVAARFGGEEFAIVLPETGPREALRLAERIRHAVAASAFDVRTAIEPVRATISIGVASFPSDAGDANDLVHQADVAAYRAKQEGRNRVAAAADGTPDPDGGERSPRLVAIEGERQALAWATGGGTAGPEASFEELAAGHAHRVRQIALAIGRELALAPAQLETLGLAALFHDIGKLTIPDAVLGKPGELSAEEWAQVRRHAEDGAEIVGSFGFLDEAVPAIRHHHERFDGSGYPDGLAREEIPLGARIVHVAEAFDSMRSTRGLDAVLAELRREAGRQFCPRCVSALEGALVRDDPSLWPATPATLAAAS